MSTTRERSHGYGTGGGPVAVADSRVIRIGRGDQPGYGDFVALGVAPGGLVVGPVAGAMGDNSMGDPTQQGAGAVGGAVAAASHGPSIMTGVLVGLGVWLGTKLLDHFLFDKHGGTGTAGTTDHMES